MWSTTPIGKLWCSFNAQQQCTGISISKPSVSKDSIRLIDVSGSNDGQPMYHTSLQQDSSHHTGAQILEQQLREYFQGLRTMFDIPIFYTGTPFQLRVWKQVETIPYGSFMSYKDIAVAIGAPNSYRAVGHTVGLNPLSIIVPCHRVVRSDGTIGEYALHTMGVRGRSIKQFLLNLESQNQHRAR